METKFIAIMALGLSCVMHSQANVDPIRAGAVIGGVIVMGAVSEAKCRFADREFNAMEVKSPYLNLSTSTLKQAKSASKGARLKVKGKVFPQNSIVADALLNELLLKDEEESLNVALSNDIVCGVSPTPYQGENVYFYGQKNAQGGLDVEYWTPQNPLERQSWNYKTEYDYPSFQVLEQTAQQVDSDYVQFLLAKAYYDGKLVTKNDKKAFEWAKKSYEKQRVRYKDGRYFFAGPLLGVLYAEGKGTQQNFKQAKVLLKKTHQYLDHHSHEISGFEELYGKAIYTYGMMYYQGNGVKKDPDKALDILSVVIDKKQEYAPKSKEAETLYRNLYAEKHRTPYSPDSMHIAHFYSVALSQYHKGEHAKALDTFEKLGKEGDTDSQVMAGLIHYESDIVPQNIPKAKEWYLKAFNYKHPKAAYNLAVLYYNEEDSTKKAKYYYQKACEWGEKAACREAKELK